MQGKVGQLKIDDTILQSAGEQLEMDAFRQPVEVKDQALKSLGETTEQMVDLMGGLESGVQKQPIQATAVKTSSSLRRHLQTSSIDQTHVELTERIPMKRH